MRVGHSQTVNDLTLEADKLPRITLSQIHSDSEILWRQDQIHSSYILPSAASFVQALEGSESELIAEVYNYFKMGYFQRSLSEIYPDILGC